MEANHRDRWTTSPVSTEQRIGRLTTVSQKTLTNPSEVQTIDENQLALDLGDQVSTEECRLKRQEEAIVLVHKLAWELGALRASADIEMLRYYRPDDCDLVN
jgi:hypothetical protein